MDRKISRVAVRADRNMVRGMVRWACCGVAMIMSLFCGKPAHAEGGAAHTTWMCWQDSATSLSCHLSQDGDTAPAAVPEPAAGTATPASSSRTRPLPRVARQILERPEQFQGRRISIPMYSEPEEREFMVQLAEAVMCGVRKACSVEFLRTISEVALAQDAIDDPAIN
ncbi:MAG TPA: hypothetical protein VJ673_08775 [Aromatoleum sp.]|uniref:hypothetical protein n=1 Tax=Aromatoleum sp. TaxID=2307007 RepID=UPI002B49C062|nr:hypothetical protein [Aromatoleum sp.]HJV25769.1 hypothetical protein [Aromatoleum sp.]